jgi:hypothetical protein
VEDKTFGLKNKNKSSKVQAYIKNVHQNVFNEKGGESKKIEDQQRQKEEKKQKAAHQNLLMSMFKDLQGLDKKGKKKKEQEEIKNEEGMTESERTESINYYRDPREDYEDLIKNVTTDKICNHFLDAIEKAQYGFRWKCPNGGDKCQYKHALPEGYVFE